MIGILCVHTNRCPVAYRNGFPSGTVSKEQCQEALCTEVWIPRISTSIKFRHVEQGVLWPCRKRYARGQCVEALLGSLPTAVTATSRPEAKANRPSSGDAPFFTKRMSAAESMPSAVRATMNVRRTRCCRAPAHQDPPSPEGHRTVGRGASNSALDVGLLLYGGQRCQGPWRSCTNRIPSAHQSHAAVAALIGENLRHQSLAGGLLLAIGALGIS